MSNVQLFFLFIFYEHQTYLNKFYAPRQCREHRAWIVASTERASIYDGGIQIAHAAQPNSQRLGANTTAEPGTMRRFRMRATEYMVPRRSTPKRCFNTPPKPSRKL
ncbi:hypothetical protein SAMN05216466_11852 [Paraburkholderia phenazinium]|uniref:Uncharacterized protein n=1 Tax=Paraburkholderia phenazinium TaxID=60549 RepID=A0A1G8IDB1_9BURK|nr:hypothetical protein SAMN05216466_11852 [Paraburkholderia phenazinium]